jgi:type IV secretory pathway ATPase VirB11/archaellum biosynthesis ATPase
MAADYTYDEETMKLKVNVKGLLFGPSIEDFDLCMAAAMEALLEAKNVSSLVMVRDREYEYDYEQVKLLLEMVQIIEDVVNEKLFSTARMESRECTECYPQWRTVLDDLVDLLKKDPIGAYVKVIRDIRRLQPRISRARNVAAIACLKYYRDKILGALKERLEATSIIKDARPRVMGYHIGDRKPYRQFFNPTIKPVFMFTRYLIHPPDGCESLDRYMVGDAQIEILRAPKAAHYLYFIMPPEFRLKEEQYTVLEAAREHMASHRPTAEEFVRSEKVREIFFNISKDTVRNVAGQLGIRLSANDMEMLARVLTRHTAGYGVMEVLLADEKIQDLYINSPVGSQPIMIFHQDWEECRTNLVPTMEDAEAWATRLRIQSGRPLDEANPVLDIDIGVPGGKARFAVITRSLSPEGLGFAIRRHRFKPWTLPLFIKYRMINPLAAGLLSFLVDGSAAMLIAGGRSSGKTSVLGSLMLELLPKTRIVVIEDTLELPIFELSKLGYNIESLKSRSVITRVETEMPADEALRTSLRLGDSAMIVGEIRSLEAKALWEAMRIGALSNVVAGTIHGESAYGVFDRVVNDLQVPKTSFKATDVIPVCKMLRTADGLHRFRRMTEITEVRKRWESDPMKEGGLVNLMEYSSKEDGLKPTDTFVNGESEVINRIASYVREWSGNWETVWDNINLRAKMKKTMLDMAEKLGRPELMEAEWTTKSNTHFHLIEEKLRGEVGAAEADEVYERWLGWFKGAIK